MERKIVKQLKQWKQSPDRMMPLVLNGARQVGKTYIALMFGKQEYKTQLISAWWISRKSLAYACLAAMIIYIRVMTRTAAKKGAII